VDQPLLLLPELLLQHFIDNFIFGNVVQVVVVEMLINLPINLNVEQAGVVVELSEVVGVHVEQVPWPDWSVPHWRRRKL